MKRQRQAAILRLVRSGKIGSQVQLAGLLEREGFPASQTTISRDLRDLGLARGSDGEGARYMDSRSARHREDGDGYLSGMASRVMLTCESTGNLVVVRTSPGNAQGLAWALDAAQVSGIAGTVAGDDTILVVCSAGVDSKKVGRKLMAYALEGKVG